MAACTLIILALSFDSGAYWEKRYATGGNSGAGSYGVHAEYKARFLNDFVAAHGVRSVAEFGFGDGNQLKLAKYPKYTGFDVSATAVRRARKLLEPDKTKSFFVVNNFTFSQPIVDLSLSLDVVYHLTEDGVFDLYMRRLFSSATRHVIIYASNEETPYEQGHVRHRHFSAWVDQHMSQHGWKYNGTEANPHGCSLRKQASCKFGGTSVTFAQFHSFVKERRGRKAMQP